ncbi:MAG: TfoX/Sxy family protein [Bacteriovoracia bacterium]
MPYDLKLAERVRKVLQETPRVTEKKMFGGLAFMLADKMCCGVLKDKLVARIGSEQYEWALKRANVKPMDFTGRPLKGYVYIGPKGVRTNASLNYWIQRSIAFTATLIGKAPSKARRRTVSQIESPETARTMPLSKLLNFGPVTLPEFRAMGITTFGQLEDLGWEAVCRKWVEHFPERLNANAFLGVIATLEGISWTKVSASDKAKARGLVKALRQEYGFPPAPRKTPKKHQR